MLEIHNIELGALTSAPVYEAHARGKNWMAVVSSDPTSPGGLDRDFLDKAKGKYYYMVKGMLAPGDIVEFGADYYSSGGKKHPCRKYAKVVEITEDTLTLDVYDTFWEAENVQI